jgi:ATP-binding cassette, subfamily B, bacterial PglK
MDTPDAFTGPVNLGNPGEFTIKQLAEMLIFTIKLVYTPLLLAWVRARYVQSVVRAQSVRLFDAYLRAPYEFHLRRNSSELIRNVTAEAPGWARSCSAR